MAGRDIVVIGGSAGSIEAGDRRRALPRLRHQYFTATAEPSSRKENDLVRFRCRVGRAHSDEALLVHQSEPLEAAL